MKRAFKLLFVFMYVSHGRNPNDSIERIKNAEWLFELLWEEINKKPHNKPKSGAL